MKRLLSFLITLSVLGVGLILCFTLFVVGQHEFDLQVDQQVNNVHKQVRERFRVFDELIANDERELHKQARRALLRLSEVLDYEHFDPADWDPQRLQKLSDEYKVDAIYVIDRSTKVIATNFIPDLGFELGTISTPFKAYINQLYGTGRIEVDRINVSSQTGILQLYAYYAPLNSDYIIEVSYDVKNHLTRSHSSRYVNFMFGDFFTELAKTNPMLEKVDIYLVNNYAAFPFLDNTPPIKTEELPEIPTEGVITVKGKHNILHHYSRADLKRSNLHSADYLVIRSTFNLSSIYHLMHKFLGISLVVILIVLGLAFLLISFLFDKWIIRRIFRIIAALERSADGDYSDQIVSGRKDELGLISDHINSMNRRISLRDEELHEARLHLEHRVVERTADLQQQIEARKQAEKKLIALASTDPLTQVLNRRAFDEQALTEIERAHRHNRPLALILLDIDHFKKVNDRYGHKYGDQVLVDIAKLIQPCLRTTDYLCRHGGEEFIVLLPETRPEQAVQLAERLREEIENCQIFSDQQHFSVTASFGVSTWERHESDIQSATHRADNAMYEAKRLGRNRVILFNNKIKTIETAEKTY